VPRGGAGRGPPRRCAVMNLPADFGAPTDFRVWILLGYAVAVIVGAWVLDWAGRAHFRRARQYAEAGVGYDEAFDHYECPEGERLPLHVIDESKRVAVYRAPASSCANCPRKADCTPHDHGRHLYRPLAAWAETDSGRFHRWLGVVMNGSAAVVGGVATAWWAGRPGAGWLLAVSVLAATISIVTVIRTGRGTDAGQNGSHPGDTPWVLPRHRAHPLPPPPRRLPPPLP